MTQAKQITKLDLIWLGKIAVRDRNGRKGEKTPQKKLTGAIFPKILPRNRERAPREKEMLSESIEKTTHISLPF